MPHVKFDDRFPNHPKVAGLTDAAYRLHTSGIFYCGMHLTDGLISADEVPRLVRRFRRKSLAELVDRGLWIPILDGGAYEVHDYLQWNDSRETVLARQENARKRKEKWLAAREGRGVDERP